MTALTSQRRATGQMCRRFRPTTCSRRRASGSGTTVPPAAGPTKSGASAATHPPILATPARTSWSRSSTKPLQSPRRRARAPPWSSPSTPSPPSPTPLPLSSTSNSYRYESRCTSRKTAGLRAGKLLAHRSLDAGMRLLVSYVFVFFHHFRSNNNGLIFSKWVLISFSFHILIVPF